MNSGIPTYTEFKKGNIIISKKNNNNNNKNKNNKILGIVNQNSKETNSEVVVAVKNPFGSHFGTQKKRYKKNQVQKKVNFENYNVGNVVLKKKNGKILGVVNKKSNKTNSKVNVKVEKSGFNPLSMIRPNIKTYNKIYVEKKKNLNLTTKTNLFIIKMENI